MSAKFVFCSFLATMAMVLPGCDSNVAGPGPAAAGAPLTPAELAKADDEAAKDLLDDKTHIAEAKDWLSPNHENHVLWKGDRKAITQLVNDLYEAGATKIWAADTNEMGKNQIVAMFVAELPTDKDKRAKVFEVHNNFWKKAGGSAEDVAEFLIEEQGQKYILLDFDN